MKKVLFLVFALAVCFSMCLVCFAEEMVEQPDVKSYIQDKIVPVAVGVLTSVIAFVATIGVIAKSLKSLKDTKEAFSNEAEERACFFESGIAQLEAKAESMRELISDVPSLQEKVGELIKECELLAEILSLGFSANEEIIKSGKGKKMALLLENATVNAKRKVQSVESEQNTQSKGKQV